MITPADFRAGVLTGTIRFMIAITRTTLLVASIAFTVMPSALAQKQKCQDIPVRAAIATSYADTTGVVQSRFYGDGAIYEDGVDGVKATIQTCNGTNDAVVNIIGSRRRVAWLDLTQALTANPPAWTLAPVEVKMSFNANNAQYPATQFTTFMGISFSANRTNYQLKFVPPSTGTGTGPNQALINNPSNTSAVIVNHYPAAGATPETWVFTSAAPVTETMLGDGPVNLGQFTVPFQITITRK